MRKIAIYGMGEQFEKNVIQNKFVLEKIKECDLIGFIDKNKGGSIIRFNNINYTIVKLTDWTDFDLDRVVITSYKYKDEIKEELKEYGFLDDQICTLDKLVFEFLDCKSLIEIYMRGKGIEVGGPSGVFSYIYDVCQSCDGVNFSVDTVWWKQNKYKRYTWENREIGEMYIADATNLAGIASECYDFVLSCNNLEHIANPIKALKEFYRIIRKDGIIILVVPRKYVNFDHDRTFTTFGHLLNDYKNDVSEEDLSHLEEILEKHDYTMDLMCPEKEKFAQRAKNNFENRCLHHHVFDKKCLVDLFTYLEINILEFEETYSDYWIIGQK